MWQTCRCSPVLTLRWCFRQDRQSGGLELVAAAATEQARARGGQIYLRCISCSSSSHSVLVWLQGQTEKNDAPAANVPANNFRSFCRNITSFSHEFLFIWF